MKALLITAALLAATPAFAHTDDAQVLRIETEALTDQAMGHCLLKMPVTLFRITGKNLLGDKSDHWLRLAMKDVGEACSAVAKPVGDGGWPELPALKGTLEEG